MDKALKILACGSALPKGKLTNFDFEKMVDTSDEWIKERTGIEERRICGQGENAKSLAIEAAALAIKRAKEQDKDFSEDKIGAILVASTTHDEYLPSIACYIQEALNLPDRVLAFDLEAACSGFVFGMKTAAALLNSYPEKYVLLVGAESLSSFTDSEDRGTCILFGDGAGAAVVTLADSDSGFACVSHATGNNTVLGARHGAKLHMEGQEVFKFATRVVVSAIGELLEESKLTLDDIDFVICHQANARIIDYVKRKFKGHEDKFLMNIKNLGNTSAASIPIALDEFKTKGILKEGMKIVTVGFGGGLTWGAALIEL